MTLTTNVHLPETAVVQTEWDTCSDASWEVRLVHLPNRTEPSRIPSGSQWVPNRFSGSANADHFGFCLLAWRKCSIQMPSQNAGGSMGHGSGMAGG
jgi:hypothetical protein